MKGEITGEHVRSVKFKVDKNKFGKGYAITIVRQKKKFLPKITAKMSFMGDNVDSYKREPTLTVVDGDRENTPRGVEVDKAVHKAPEMNVDTKRPKKKKIMTKARVQGVLANLRGQVVIAKDNKDGIYYEGVVLSCPNPRYAKVKRRCDEKVFMISTKFLLPIKGAIPSPQLRVGDYVLVRVINMTTDRESYVPGIVQVPPVKQEMSGSYYSVLIYNRQTIVTLRRHLVKISKERFDFTVDYLCQMLKEENGVYGYKQPVPDVVVNVTVEQKRKHVKHRSGRRRRTRSDSRSGESRERPRTRRLRSRSRSLSEESIERQRRQRSRSQSIDMHPAKDDYKSSRCRPGTAVPRGKRQYIAEVDRYSSESLSDASIASDENRRRRDRSRSDSNYGDSGERYKRRNHRSSSGSESEELVDKYRERMQKTLLDSESDVSEDTYRERRGGSRSSSRSEERRQRRKGSTSPSASVDRDQPRMPKRPSDKQKRIRPSRYKKHQESSKIEHTNGHQNEGKQIEHETRRERMCMRQSSGSDNNSSSKSRSRSPSNEAFFDEIPNEVSDREKSPHRGSPTPNPHQRRKRRKDSPSEATQIRRDTKSRKGRVRSTRAPRLVEANRYDRMEGSCDDLDSPETSAEDLCVHSAGEVVHSAGEVGGVQGSVTTRLEEQEERLREMQRQLLDQDQQHRQEQEELKAQIQELKKMQREKRREKRSKKYMDRESSEDRVITILEEDVPIGKSSEDKIVTTSPDVASTDVDMSHLISPRPVAPKKALALLEMRKSLPPIRLNEEVMARWSDEGWYYRGSIVLNCNDFSYMVRDSTGEMERIWREDIITEADDAKHVINAGDTVIALHPHYVFSYAPARVSDVLPKLQVSVTFFDNEVARLQRDEVYKIPRIKYSHDVKELLRCENQWVGQAVVARNDDTGCYGIASVTEKIPNKQLYGLEWYDGSVCRQTPIHMFGAFTRRHKLAVGERILAVSDEQNLDYLPGWIIGEKDGYLKVRFCNGTILDSIDPDETYWISLSYFDHAVVYYNKRHTANTVSPANISEA